MFTFNTACFTHFFFSFHLLQNYKHVLENLFQPYSFLIELDRAINNNCSNFQTRFPFLNDKKVSNIFFLLFDTLKKSVSPLRDEKKNTSRNKNNTSSRKWCFHDKCGVAEVLFFTPEMVSEPLREISSSVEHDRGICWIFVNLEQRSDFLVCNLKSVAEDFTVLKGRIMR